MFDRTKRLLGAILVSICMVGGAGAAELTIGSRATPTIDPHFLFLTSNLAYNSHIYGFLVGIHYVSSRAFPEVPYLDIFPFITR